MSRTRESLSLSTTTRWSGARVWAETASSDLASSSGRRCVTTTAYTDSVIGQCCLLFARGAHRRCRPVRPMLVEDLAHMAGGVLALICPDDVLNAAGHLDRAVIDPHRGLAQSRQELVGM